MWGVWNFGWRRENTLGKWPSRLRAKSTLALAPRVTLKAERLAMMVAPMANHRPHPPRILSATKMKGTSLSASSPCGTTANMTPTVNT